MFLSASPERALRARLRRRMPEHAVSLGGEAAHQPVRLDRVARPDLGPAVGDAGLDRFPGNLAAVTIEQREFSTGLVEAALEIAPLRRAWPHGRLNGVFMMVRRGSGIPAQARVTARGFPIARTHSHGRHPLTMIKKTLPKRFNLA